MGELKYLGQADSEMHARAFAAWFRTCKKDGTIPEQPTAPDHYTLGDRDYIVLQNARGVLAVYRITLQKTLKRLRRIPKEILAVVEGGT
jgi:hypothetical protein